MVTFFGTTPTLYEYVRATLMPNPVRLWSDKSGETTMYWNINMYSALAYAYYKKGETVAMLRFMMALRATPAYLMAGIVGAHSHLLGSHVSGMTQKQKISLLSGAPTPGGGDSLLDKLLKLSDL